MNDTYMSAYHLILRTTATLDDDIHEAVVSHARATGQSLGRVLSHMARQALQPESHRGPAALRGGRFAAFDVPADAGLIPASRIQQALE